MWTAIGTFLGEPLDLVWDNGPKDWPDWLVGAIDEGINDGIPVPMTQTGPYLDVSWQDERTIIAYLDQIGDVISLRGDRPTTPVPEKMSTRPPGGPPTIY